MIWLFDPQIWGALITLTALEIILGMDNLIFLTLLVGRLPKSQQKKGRLFGLLFAMGTRIMLLLALATAMQIDTPLFSILGVEYTFKNLILIGGGLFLIIKSSLEIKNSLKPPSTSKPGSTVSSPANFWYVIIQIGCIDLIFSLDSIITAVGLVNQISMMITAIVLAILVMLFAAPKMGEWIERYPTLKILALSFLILIGIALIGDGLSFNFPKSYIYFAMGFAVGVEGLNLRLRAISYQSP
jgi:predicted tellurium resistance membrane protein TerC